MTDRRTSYRSVFAVRGYTALYSGTSLVLVGSSLQVLAFSITVFDATRSPIWSSAAFAAGFLPQVIGGAVLPSIADRLPGRVLLPLGSLIRAISAAVLASGVAGTGGGIAVIALAALLQPLSTSAQSVLVARLLTGDRYVLGRSLFTMTSMIAQLLGLAVGGVAVQTLGPAPALAVAALVQAASAVVFLVGLPSVPPPGRSAAPWHIAETIVGYREVLRVPLLRGLLLLWWIPIALFVGAESVVVAYAGAIRADGITTAVLLGAPPAGALVGEVAIGRLCLPSTRERLVGWLLALTGVGLLPFAFTPGAPAAALSLFVAAIGLSYSLGRQEAFRSGLPVGREAVGFGLLGVGMMTAQGLGPLLAGPLASWLSPGVAIAICGTLVLASVLGFRGVLAADRSRPAHIPRR